MSIWRARSPMATASAGVGRTSSCAPLAGWARIQLIVLIPIVVVAHLVDLARAGSDWRARAVAHRTVLIAGAAGVALLVVAWLAGSDGLFGIYSNVLHYSPSPGDVL